MSSSLTAQDSGRAEPANAPRDPVTNVGIHVTKPWFRGSIHDGHLFARSASRWTEEGARHADLDGTMTEARRWLGLPDEDEPPRPESGASNVDADRLPRIVPVEFRDPSGVRWMVVPRLVRSGAEVVPDGFEFESEHGERRFLRWEPKYFFSPREVGHATWRDLLRSATVVT
jgi:hypothetical protein